MIQLGKFSRPGTKVGGFFFLYLHREIINLFPFPAFTRSRFCRSILKRVYALVILASILCLEKSMYRYENAELEY